MEDHGGAGAMSETIKNRECGNGVVIKHTGGWKTQYCHLSKGSIIVKSGQPVKKGQKLGLIGFSGQTIFPHVHMATRFKDKIVDPFIGLSSHPPCSLGTYPLWDDDLIPALTQPLMYIFNSGFSGIVPKKDAVLAGVYKEVPLSRQAPYLMVWAYIYRVQKGDHVHIQITGPNGNVFSSHHDLIKKNKARMLLYSGKKRKNLYWPQGIYKSHITIRRPNDDGLEHVVAVNKKIFVR
jgi:hypothetical protein